MSRETLSEFNVFSRLVQMVVAEQIALMHLVCAGYCAKHFKFCFIESSEQLKEECVSISSILQLVKLRFSLVTSTEY